MLPPAHFHGKLIRKRSLCKSQQNGSPENFRYCLCVILVGSTVVERTFLLIRQINSWLRNSMMMDLLRDLAIIAMHGDAYLFKKHMQCRYEHPPS